MKELNTYLLSKMGWIAYSKYRGIGFIENKLFFENDEYVRFFLNYKNESLFVIKELTRSEKQKNKNNYKFIYTSINNINFQIIEFNNTYELLKLIAEYEACDNEKYKRFFRLKKLI